MAAAKTKKRPMGRPPMDPGDLRSERIAVRLHPDVFAEIGLAARELGTLKSLFVERILINWINQRLVSRGRRPVDAIGKYLSEDKNASGLVELPEFQEPLFDYRVPRSIRKPLR